MNKKETTYVITIDKKALKKALNLADKIELILTELEKDCDTVENQALTAFIAAFTDFTSLYLAKTMKVETKKNENHSRNRFNKVRNRA